MRSKVLFRSDGSTSIGMGHVVRCIALADMLKPHFELTFAIRNSDKNVLNIIKNVVNDVIIIKNDDDDDDDEIAQLTQHLTTNDILVLDGYQFKSSYQQSIKNLGYKLVFIDDLIDDYQYADVIINQAQNINPSNYRKELNTQLYLGLNYALLRPVFISNKHKKTNTKLRKVIISMGAADINNLSLKFAKVLVKAKNVEEINLVLGAVNPNLKEIDQFINERKDLSIKKHFNLSAEEIHELLIQNDLIICPASGTILEACAVGITIVSGFTADNQIDNLRGFDKEGILYNLGNLVTADESLTLHALEKLSEEPELVKQRIRKQRILIDKKSPERILKIFKNLDNDKLHFRFANENDVMKYFEWTNDEVVRIQSFNQEKVDLQSHITWFNNKLSSENCYFYLFLEKSTNKEVGQIRIDKNSNENIIGISIDKHFRGKGFGEEMVRKATKHYLQTHSDSTIAAYIKLENIASYKTFLKAGFFLKEQVEIDGFKSYKLLKNRS